MFDAQDDFVTIDPNATFGETINRLPDLNKWKYELTKRLTKKGFGPGLSQANTTTAPPHTTTDADIAHTTHTKPTNNTTSTTLNTSDDEEEEADEADANELPTTNSMRTKKRSIIDIMNADDHISAITYSNEFLGQRKSALKSGGRLIVTGINNKTKSAHTNNTNSSTDNKVSLSHEIQMNKLREESKQAYQVLKLKRRNTNNT